MKRTKIVLVTLVLIASLILTLSACDPSNPSDTVIGNTTGEPTVQTQPEKTDATAVDNTQAPTDAPATAVENTQAPTDAPATAVDNTQAPTDVPATAVPEITPEPHQHVFTQWKSDESTHWQECECGEAGEKAPHTVVKDEAVAATCTEAGKTEGSHCGVCGKVLTAQETVPAAGHKPKTVAGKEPTTTSEGLTEGKVCSVCGAVLVKQETIPKLINYTEPTQEQINEMNDVALRAVTLFGKISDTSALSVEKQMRYYFLFLNRNNSYEFYDTWEDISTEDDFLDHFRYTVSAAELKEWFRKHLGTDPDLTTIKHMPVDDWQISATNDYLFTADYVASNKTVTITQYGFVGWGGGGPEPFRPYYKYDKMTKSGNEYLFVSNYITKEKPADMTGVKTSSIVEVKYYYNDTHTSYEEWWSFYDETNAEELADYDNNPEVEYKISEVYFIPTSLVAEHIDGEFCIKCVR